MAKGNMLQGMATGKLGDVVFARANGEQISRVRNRHPKNPRSNKQMYQRAVMATVMQAYSAGQEIFNHAFQGKSVGAENQRAFLSKNSKLLRGLIAAEIEAGTSALNCNAAVVAPGAITPVPNEYMISEGTYPQNFFGWNDASKTFIVPSPAGETETVAQYADRLGLVAGDIYTFVVMLISGSNPSFTVRGVTTATTGAYKPESQYPCTFAFVRLQVKDVSAVTTLAESATLATFFEITASKNANFSLSANPDGEFSLTDIVSASAFPAVSNGLATVGVIRSRLDQDLRSTSFMKIASLVSSRATAGMYGITSPLALAAWQQGTEALGDSDLILEGGDE